MLSQIAPVLMQSEEFSTYGTPWQSETRTVGRALDMEDKAEALISGVEITFAAARDRHPDWAGRTAVAAWHDGGQTGAEVGAHLCDIAFHDRFSLRWNWLMIGFKRRGPKPSGISATDAARPSGTRRSGS